MVCKWGLSLATHFYTSGLVKGESSGLCLTLEKITQSWWPQTHLLAPRVKDIHAPFSEQPTHNTIFPAKMRHRTIRMTFGKEIPGLGKGRDNRLQ